jgi:mono/diheme cytochrome c family protein
VRSLIALLLLAATAHAEPLSPLVVNNCLMCHSEEMLEQQRLTPKQWAAVVKKMIGWGAPVEPENVEPLVAWLSAHYGPDAGPWAPRPTDTAKLAEVLAAQPDGAVAKASAARGAKMYAVACASCHGADGRGSPTGMNLIDRLVLHRPADFADVIKRGRGRMPAFATLPRSDVAGIIVWLRKQ